MRRAAALWPLAAVASVPVEEEEKEEKEEEEVVWWR